MNETDRLEQISEFYTHGDRMDELGIDRQVEIIKSYPSKGKSVIEIGCGSGYSTAQLIDTFTDYHVVEASEENCNLLRKRLGEKTPPIGRCLFEDLIPNTKYDYIFFTHIIEHIENPVEALRKCYAMLKDDGMIFISAPNCMSLNRRIGVKIGMLDTYEKLAPKDIRVGHRRLYTVGKMKEHCELAGLKIIDMKGIYLKPLSEIQMYEMDSEVVKALHYIGEEIPEYCATIMAIAGKEYYV
jgi:2-polyprenyl-3-methyl-5-hydroxy-6-metoxy-1,4-benzoquinol methylase